MAQEITYSVFAVTQHNSVLNNKNTIGFKETAPPMLALKQQK
jgi:hypothetical protein